MRSVKLLTVEQAAENLINFGISNLKGKTFIAVCKKNRPQTRLITFTKRVDLTN